MRIVFVNLHSDEFLVKTSDKFLFKSSVAVKHKYFLDYLLSRDDCEVACFVNEKGFPYTRNLNNSLIQSIGKAFRFVDCRYVLKKNGLKKKVEIIRRASDVTSDDIVIMYNRDADTFAETEKINAFKALNMVHFTIHTNRKAMIESSKVNCFVSESNLSNNSLVFQELYSVDLPWIIVPFVYSSRFKVVKDFHSRKNKAMAVGTITYVETPEFLSIYGDSCLQPSRKQILDNPSFFESTVDCFSNNYIETGSLKEVKPEDNIFIQIQKKLYNRTHAVQQKKYFSFDMVEKFNEYRMCVVGEEIVGVPGIGYVEGMACGCAYIGLDSPMYRDVGLIPGVHYIAYDGTKEGLRKKIEYYQRPENYQELERIAKNGCQYVRENFIGTKVAEMQFNALVELQKEWRKNNG